MKYCLSSEPRTPPTRMRPSAEVNASLRVACCVVMLSTVRLFGNEPGD